MGINEIFENIKKKDDKKFLPLKYFNNVALILAIFSYVEMLIKRFSDMIFETASINIPSTDNALHLMDLLYRKGMMKPLYISSGRKVYYSAESYVRSKQKVQLIPYGGFQFFNRWVFSIWKNKPIWIYFDSKSIQIKYIRFTASSRQLIEDIIKVFNDEVYSPDVDDEEGESRFTIIRITGSVGSQKDSSGKSKKGTDVSEELVEDDYNYDEDAHNIVKYEVIGFDKNDIGQPRNKDAIERMSLKKIALDAAKEALAWKTHEKWFKEKHIPWKKGWMLYGKPGTGKTCFVRSLGQKLDIPIFVIDLATMSNKDMAESWNYMLGYTPCVALIEDIDAVFNQRKNISTHPDALTFDCFLNCVDGVINTDGVFTIITTNDITKLDPAIAGISENDGGMTTRPGRIDRAILFDELDRPGREKMANHLLNGFDSNMWSHIIDEGHKDTGAQFQERCCRLAVQLFWENPDIIEVK